MSCSALRDVIGRDLGTFIKAAIAALVLGACLTGCDSVSPADAGQAETDPCTASSARSGDACTGGVCLAETGGKLSCHATCALSGSICTQMNGLDGTCCQWGTAHQLACMPMGSENPGSCSKASDCTSGAQCLEVGGNKHCYIVCTDTCEDGICTDTGQGFKVCLAQ